MAEYQKIEYRIGKDGKVTETVINGNGEPVPSPPRISKHPWVKSNRENYYLNIMMVMIIT
jgi:hypothetical protein